MPLSCLYGALVRIRHGLYARGILRAQRLPVPVIVVGNVLAGGTGKTPIVLALVEHLLKQRWTVGVVSRGYGRRSHDVRDISAHDTPADVGDEPFLIHKKLGVPVVVGADRVAAAQLLLKNHPDIRIIVSDDGAQHLGLFRDMELIVFDQRRQGNGCLLPAGPLRTPWPMAPAHRVGPPADRRLLLSSETTPPAGMYAVRRALDDHGIDRNGRRIALHTLHSTNVPCVAVAGIGTPEIFFSMLRGHGVALAQTHALPDHFDFSHWAPSLPNPHWLLCTEKDVDKLRARFPDAIAVALQATFSDALIQTLDQRIDELRRRGNAKV